MKILVAGWAQPNVSAFLGARLPRIWFVSLLVGVLAGMASIMFREAIGLVQWFWASDRSENLASAARGVAWYYVFFAPILGGLLVGLLLQRFIPARRAGGVSDVIETRALGGRALSTEAGLWSGLVSAISLGSGASAGREGPMVHLAATITGWVNDRFTLPDWGKRTLLAAGVASAVSASFNAPIAGVLFAHEVILGHYAMRSFVPIVIASVSGGVLSRQWFSEASAFDIPSYTIESNLEFPAFALLGVACAAVAIAFQLALISADYAARRVTLPLWLRPAIGGVAIGTMGVFLPEILGVGYEPTDQALKGQFTLQFLLLLLVAKTAATAITLASRFGGGVFSPSLYLGAMTGGAFGVISASLLPAFSSDPGLYATLGMGAVAAAVIGAPISTVVIVFELTGGYAITIALLLTVSIAVGLNQAIHGRSFFEWQLESRGLFVHDGPHKYLVKRTRVREFMRLQENEEDAQPVVYDPDVGTPFLVPTDTLEKALRLFDGGGHTALPVLENGSSETIIGWADQTRALAFFNRALIDASVEEHR
ncbi:MAG: chloride channel protein [Pseudomonadota bacterium]